MQPADLNQLAEAIGALVGVARAGGAAGGIILGAYGVLWALRQFNEWKAGQREPEPDPHKEVAEILERVVHEQRELVTVTSRLADKVDSQSGVIRAIEAATAKTLDRIDHDLSRQLDRIEKAG